MIDIESLVVTVAGTERADVEHLIALDCLRPAWIAGAWLFCEIDVARLRLIQDLRRDFALQEEALPIILHLLDQLYYTRRSLLRLRDAVEQAAPPEIWPALLAALSASPGAAGNASTHSG